MNAAQVQPPPREPFCSAVVREVPPSGGDQGTLMCEVRGYPEYGGAYYWTPAQARAIFLALRTFNVLGDGA